MYSIKHKLMCVITTSVSMMYTSFSIFQHGYNIKLTDGMLNSNENERLSLYANAIKTYAYITSIMMVSITKYQTNRSKKDQLLGPKRTAIVRKMTYKVP